MPRGWGTKYNYESPPRQAMSAYAFYTQDYYRYWRRAIRTRDPRRVIEEVANQWSHLDDDEKDKYHKMAAQDKERAKMERLEYYKMIDEGRIQPPPLRVRVSKQEGYPRATRNAFTFFSNEVRNTIRRENPEWTYVDVMREMGKRWRSMDRDARWKYIDLKNRDKARYKAARSDFWQRQKESKRKMRLQEARARLNRLYNQKIPSAFADQVNFKAEEAK